MLATRYVYGGEAPCTRDSFDRRTMRTTWIYPHDERDPLGDARVPYRKKMSRAKEIGAIANRLGEAERERSRAVARYATVANPRKKPTECVADSNPWEDVSQPTKTRSNAKEETKDEAVG